MAELAAYRWASGSVTKLIRRIARLARPTLLFEPGGSRSFSKLGGDPQLPPKAAWPAGAEGPRAFLAQVDLGEVSDLARIDWLPAEGRLYAFLDPSTFGAPDLVRITFSTEAPGPPARQPEGVAERYRERRVEFTPLNSVPSLEWLDVRDPLDLEFEEFEARLQEFGAQPPREDRLHRIGGYPDGLQNGCLGLECEHLARGLPPPDYVTPAAIERASREWRLLLQIDSDRDLGMEFGDAGRLYVFIREATPAWAISVRP